MDHKQQLYNIWGPYAQNAHRLAFRLTQSALGPGRSSGRLDDLARGLHREFDRVTEATVDPLPGADSACAPGCDHCCQTLRVTVSSVEIIGIVRGLREARSTDPILEERLRRSSERRCSSSNPSGPSAQAPSGDDPSAEEARTWRGMDPCPLLTGGLCIVYSSRPLACRGCVSADAALCA